MLLVDAMDLGLHLGMPALDQDGEFTDQPSRGADQPSLSRRTRHSAQATLGACGRLYVFSETISHEIEHASGERVARTYLQAAAERCLMGVGQGPDPSKRCEDLGPLQRYVRF
jgi:hypothetical protein